MNFKTINQCAEIEKVFEELTSMILSRSIEVSVKNNNSLPKVFYIGMGKTGSSSIKKYVNETVAHWHDEAYFETIYQTDLLTKNDICLFDLVLYLGDKYHFKPLIIESYREPVARLISGLAHRNRISEIATTSYDEFKTQLTVELIKSTSEPYSVKWQTYFSVDVVADFNNTSNYLFRELKEVNLLFLKLEDVKNWPAIIKLTGYSYENIKSNDATKSKLSDFYTEIVSKFRLSEEDLNHIYDDRFLKAFYTENEINAFKDKWKSGQ